jgi:hypothetical protein
MASSRSSGSHSVGLISALISLFLQQQGVSWKYSETGFGTIILVWCLLSVFRPEWQRRRFWLVMAAIVVAHLTGWVYLTNRIERFGFGLMFLLVVVEIMVGATVVLKAIPEDYQVMVDYIHRW